MTKLGWKTDGSVLSLIDEAGDARCLSANEIYRALVEKMPSAEGIPRFVEGLRASRYPLLPTLIISGGLNDEAPSYAIMAPSRGEGGKVALDLADLERDIIKYQVVKVPDVSPSPQPALFFS